MTPVQIEKLKKRKQKPAPPCSRKRQRIRHSKKKTGVTQKVDGMEEKISRSKEHNVRLAQSLDEGLKKTARWNYTSTMYCRTSVYGLNRVVVCGNLHESPYQF
jgi:hypothetical protein